MKTTMKKATVKPVMKNGGKMTKATMPKKAMGGKMGKKSC